MVVPTEHALNEAIQVLPLVLSDDIRQRKVSKERNVYTSCFDIQHDIPRGYLSDSPLGQVNF